MRGDGAATLSGVSLDLIRRVDESHREGIKWREKILLVPHVLTSSLAEKPADSSTSHIGIVPAEERVIAGALNRGELTGASVVREPTAGNSLNTDKQSKDQCSEQCIMINDNVFIFGKCTIMSNLADFHTYVVPTYRVVIA